MAEKHGRKTLKETGKGFCLMRGGMVRKVFLRLLAETCEEGPRRMTSTAGGSGGDCAGIKEIMVFGEVESRARRESFPEPFSKSTKT